MRSHHTFAHTLRATTLAVGLALLAACDSGSEGEPNVDPAPEPSPGIPDLSIAPVTHCSMEGIGATQLTTDDDPAKGFKATILEVSSGQVEGGTTREYCLVKVRVDPAVNIWVAMPSDGTWNGRFRSEGGGVYGGVVGVAEDSVRQGFVGVQTDTGHSAADYPPLGTLSGRFGMKEEGVPNIQLQEDFAFRSEHLMAVVGKQLTRAYYDTDPVRSYWYGCSTGGRQGLMMAQRYPDDYDAILAGAPAIHWDRFQAYQIWPQLVMREILGPGHRVSAAKLRLATDRAVASCDADDDVIDGIIDDPRSCRYDPTRDPGITYAGCADDSCLTFGEALAVARIWDGARDENGSLLWPGVERGANLGALAGNNPFPIPTEQARYWVYYDSSWHWESLTFANYGSFFQDNVERVGPLMGTDNPDLSAFKARGGKLIMYHGWSDQLIMAQGTIRYYEAVRQAMGADSVDTFVNLYMAPGMAHCSGGTGPDQFGQDGSGVVPMDTRHDVFRALMAWSEEGLKPADIIATQFVNGNPEEGVLRTRPLCPYPLVARHTGSGSTDEAANFSCVQPD